MREIMSAMKAEEKAAETDRREKEEAVTMKAGNDLDGHWVCITRVSFLVISFTSENNCLARIFPLFPPRFSFVHSRSLFNFISILLCSLFLSLLSRYAPQLQIINNFVCPRAFVPLFPFLKNRASENNIFFWPRQHDVMTRIITYKNGILILLWIDLLIKENVWDECF